MRALKFFIAALAVMAALAVVSACGGDDDGGGNGGPSDAAGTAADPIPGGESAEIVGWSLKVLSVTTDATQEVLDENQFNDEPAEGNQFYLAQIEATRVDAEAASPDSLIFEAMDADGTTYTTFDEDSRCGVIPDDLLVPNDLSEGEITIGNVCWSLPSDQASDLVMFVDGFIDRTGEPIYFTLE